MSQAKLSRRKLLQVDPETPGAEQGSGDPRAAAVQELRREQGDALATIRSVFAGTELHADERRIRALVALRGEIIESWGHARDAFLHIGRILNRMDAALTQNERDRLREQSNRLFPFSDTVASQLRQVALAVDQGRIPAALLPGSYSVAYQLALLKPAQMARAEELGLLRPDVTREAIIRFRKDIRAEALADQSAAPDVSRLRRELARLEGERRRTLEALVDLRRRMRELSAVIAREAG